MPIQSTVSSPLKSDRAAGKETSHNTLMQNLLEKLNLCPDQQEFLQPNFEMILGNLDELQTSTVSSKKNQGIKSSSFEHPRAPSTYPDKASPHKYSQDNGVSTAVTVVNPAEDKETSQARDLKSNHSFIPADYSAADYSAADYFTGDYSTADYFTNTFLEEKLIEEKLPESLDLPLKGTEIPLSLTDNFIHDTLQGINQQRQLNFDMGQEKISVVSSEIWSTGPTDFQNFVPQAVNPVHIEVQAAPVIATAVLDEQQPLLLTEEERGKFKQDLLNIDGLSEGKEGSTSELISSSKEEAALSSFPQTVKDNQPVSSVVTPFSGNQETLSSIKGIGTASSPLMAGMTSVPAFSQSSPFAATLNRSNLDRVNTLMQLKDHFQSMIKNQETYLKVNLIPAELGLIEITLDFSKDTVISTLIRAERRETMELLAQHAIDLNQIFCDAGLQSNLSNMNFSSQEDPPSSLKGDTDSQDEEENNLMVSGEAEEELDPDAWVNIKA